MSGLQVSNHVALNYLKNCPNDLLHRKSEIENSFASLFLEIGDVVQAEERNAEALALYKLFYGEKEHPLLGHIFKQAGDIENQKANTKQALGLYQQARDIFFHFLGKDTHLPDVADTLFNLGLLHADIQDFDTAEKEYSEAFKIYLSLYHKTPMLFGEQLCNTALLFGLMLVDKEIDENRGWFLIREAYQIALENSEQKWFIDFKEYIDEIQEMLL